MNDLSFSSVSWLINTRMSLKASVFRAFLQTDVPCSSVLLHLRFISVSLSSPFTLQLVIAPVPPSCRHPLSAPPYFLHLVVTSMSLHTLRSVVVACSACSYALFYHLPAVLSACLSVSLRDASQTPPFSQIQAVAGCARECACAHTFICIWVPVISSVPTSGSPNLIPLRVIYSHGGPLHTV